MKKRKKKKSKLKKRFELDASWVTFSIMRVLFIFMPAKTFPFVARYLEVISRPFTRKYRKTALENLTLSLGKEKSKEKIEYIYRACLREVAQSFCELISAMVYAFRNSSPLDHLKEKFVLEGEENLKRALSRGKGAIGLCAHFGNFTLMGTGLTSRGYPYALIVRPADESRVETYFQKWRDRLGYDSIPAYPRSTAVRRSLGALRQNKILALFADQNKAKGGVFVDFFGRPAGTVVGPAVMALRTGAPVVPIFNVRQGVDKHKVIIGPTVEFEISGNQDKDVLTVTAKITKVIEEFVRRYPTHWWWFHNRWKAKSKKEEEVETPESSTPFL
ncbi:MAG: lysophospholipid acyltransferase family protein [Elusimicrobiota bacterium]|nr:lysophospholipid acyltransferase family protein [Elusimicrobiota bacterium]